MIFIANNTREIEKNNLNLKMNISKISENLKINKIELAAHQNSSYLKTLYELYFYKTQNNNVPLIVKMKELSNQDKNNKIEIIKIISDFTKEKEIVCILVSHEEINNVPVETKSFNFS